MIRCVRRLRASRPAALRAHAVASAVADGRFQPVDVSEFVGKAEARELSTAYAKAIIMPILAALREDIGEVHWCIRACRFPQASLWFERRLVYATVCKCVQM